MSTWQSTCPFDFNILVYGFFCTPCLFGENAYTIDQRSSCVSYTLSYIAVALSAQMFGASIGYLLSHDPSVLSICSNVCSDCAIGMYAGDMRTKIRHKYGLSGTKETDDLFHCMCSTCAVCQEAQEIREQTRLEQYTMIPPEPHVMY